MTDGDNAADAITDIKNKKSRNLYVFLFLRERFQGGKAEPEGSVLMYVTDGDNAADAEFTA